MRATIMTITCLIALAAACFAFLRHVERSAQPTRVLSKMMAVRLTTGEALAEYYRQHGQYPRLPTELSLEQLRWGDEGSSAKDLQAWHYVSHGSNFTMIWSNPPRTELFLSGRTGSVFYSREATP